MRPRQREVRIVRLPILVLGGCLAASLCQAGETPAGAAPDQKYKESYSLGYEFGASLKRQLIEVDADVLLGAARAALEGRESALPPGELRETLKLLRKKVIIAEDQRYRERAAKSLEEGRKFLAENAARPGVTTRPSGLQYLVLREGAGASPGPDDLVKVHYRGRFVDGTEFDGTLGGEPAIVEPDQVVAGWREALQLMKVGAKWQVFVPPALGYGSRAYGRIPPNSTLVFEVELLGVGDELLSAASARGDEGLGGHEGHHEGEPGADDAGGGDDDASGGSGDD